MVIFPTKSYIRKQALVNKIIVDLESYYSIASKILPSIKLGPVKEYSESNIKIMESLGRSYLLYLKSEKKLVSYHQMVVSDIGRLSSATSAKV